MNVEERVSGQQRDVQTTEEGMSLVRGEWSAKEDESDSDDGCAEGNGKDQGEDTRLFGRRQLRDVA